MSCDRNKTSEAGKFGIGNWLLTIIFLIDVKVIGKVSNFARYVTSINHTNNVILLDYIMYDITCYIYYDVLFSTPIVYSGYVKVSKIGL